MSVSSIIDQTTGKIYDDLIPQGGGIPLTKGQIITADAGGVEVAFPPNNVPAPANGSILSYDATQPFGLAYIAVPGTVPLDYQELYSANAGNNITVVPAPAHNGYVLTADTDPANATGLAWKAVGGSGTLTATAPLIDEEVANVSTISINFSASVGEIPYGTGVAKTGALTVAPNPASSNQFLGTVAGVPTWKNVGGSSITGIAPIVEIAGATDESQIAIGFGASVGQLPYGNGTLNTGALTNTPTAGQILGIAGGVPAWVNAGGSGTITGTFPIVETAGGTNESVINIGYTATTGEIPVGSGTANTGVLLPKGTEGQILSVASTGIGGLKWIDNNQHTGNQIIVRSNALTVGIDPPQDPKDTLVLVAEEPNESWDAVPAPMSLPAGNYNTEFATGFVGLPGSLTQYMGLINTVNNFRVVELWRQPQGLGEAQKLGYFTFYAYAFGTLSPTADAYVRVANAYEGTGSNLDNGLYLGGFFNTFVSTASPAPPNTVCYNICRVNLDSGDVGNLQTVAVQNGLGPSFGNRDDTAGWGVFSITYQGAGSWAQPRPTLWIMGHFSSIIRVDTGSSTDGYRNMMRYFPEADGSAEYQSVANTVNLGYGVGDSTGVGGGFIYDAYFGEPNKCVVVGSFQTLSTDNGSWIPVPVGFQGLAMMDDSNPQDRWAQTPTGTVGVADGKCVRASATQANCVIVAGEDQIITPNPVIFNFTTNQTTNLTGGPTGFVNQANSISSGTVVVVGNTPAVAIDAIYYNMPNGTSSAVAYLTTGVSTLTILPPNPTGVVGSDITGVESQYGIQVSPSYNAGKIVIAGGTSLYTYTPDDPHPQIDFTLPLPNGFRQGNTITHTARFATPAFQSQSYVSSADKLYWIQTGGTATGLTYL